MFKFTKEELLSNEYSKNHEWLITNGLGGYAMSSLCGLNTRKYHGLLIAAIGESRERRLILSKVNETVEINGRSYSLSTNECPGYIEDGFVRQETFEKELLPIFEYRAKDVMIKKKISLINGENTVCIQYNIKSNKDKAKFIITPLLNNRNIHCVNLNVNYSQAYSESAVRIDLGNGIKAYMDCDGKYIEFDNIYYENMYYRIEDSRGLEHIENHYIPGSYEIDLAPYEEKEISFILSVDGMRDKNNVSSYIRKEEIRLEKYCKIAGCRNELEKALAIACDSFIVDTNSGKSIIAGYPWFNSWGRDTFISLEGLTLKTNRFSDAKNILIQFSKYINKGLVPNVLSEDGGAAYNSVDASLWYIEAVYKYIKYTNDFAFLSEIYPKLNEVVEAYKNGTDYNIHMDEDGLIIAGDEHTQLTWMDAKVGDIVPTPRYGKAVEINALWYNALRIMSYFSRILNYEFDDNLHVKVRLSFQKFYNDVGLYDTIEPYNSQIRPNQIFALGLSFPVVSGDRAIEILNIVTEKLYTDKGLKTLSNDDKQYVSKYCGGVYERDMSYHQGTVWPWLYKVYYSAYKEVKKVKYTIENTDKLLTDNCIGSIAEIYDAEEPRMAKGAPAQAWSVAAIQELI